MGKDLNGKELGKCFSQRKDGRYEARAVINGVKIDIYDVSLAKLRKNFEVEKAKVLRDEKNFRQNITLGEWYSEWFEKSKAPQLKSDVSRKTYDRKARNTYVRILKEKRVSDISQLNIQTATNDLAEEGYTDRSIKEALGIMRECLDIAIVNKIINFNPCISINVKDANVQRERRVMDQIEQKIFLEEVKDSYYYEAYMILLLTGMRIGEFSGLQWGDIDFQRKVINIRRSMQTAYQDGKKIEELTTPKVVKNINMKEYSRAMRENRAPVEFKHLHPHAFRHTFATRCFEKNMDPVFIQSIMGHANYSTTLSYTHILDKIKQREVEKAGNFLEG